MQAKRKILSRLQDDVDPMAYAANIVDAILVFSCGLIIALVSFWNLQSVIFSKTSLDEKQLIMKTVQQVVQISQGKELKDIPDVIEGTGEGYQEEGTVYRHPETGKLIMVLPEK